MILEGDTLFLAQVAFIVAHLALILVKRLIDNDLFAILAYSAAAAVLGFVGVKTGVYCGVISAVQYEVFAILAFIALLICIWSNQFPDPREEEEKLATFTTKKCNRVTSGGRHTFDRWSPGSEQDPWLRSEMEIDTSVLPQSGSIKVSYLWGRDDEVIEMRSKTECEWLEQLRALEDDPDVSSYDISDGSLATGGWM